MSGNAAISPARPRAPVWLLAMITVSGTLGIHMLAPALPDAASDLGTSNAAIQTAISVYIIGLACGQLIYGPLSDGLGRRPVLLVGLALYAISGFAAALASNIDTLVPARLFQALGGCAGLALGRAIVRDTTQPLEAVRTMALLGSMTLIGPGLASLLGSGVVAFLGWRWIFVMLALLGSITLALTWWLVPETGRPSGKIGFATLARDAARLLRSRPFLGFVVGGGCTTTSIYAFVSAAPFIFSEQLHRPVHQVGIYLCLLISGAILGNVITRRFAVGFGIDRLLLLGNALSAASALALFLVVLTGHLSMPSILVLICLFALGSGISSPAALTRSIGTDPSLVGSAAGIYGFTQMTVGALCAFLGGLGTNPALSTATVLTVAAGVGQACFWIAIRAEKTATKMA